MDLAHRFLFFLGLYAAFGMVEAVFPAEKGQPPSGRLKNIFLTVAYLFLGALVTYAATLFIPWPHTSPPYDPVRVGILLFAAIFLTDLIFYWYHRAQHASAWLWTIHALHHSDRHMNATTSHRTNVIEYPIQSFIMSAPVAYLCHLDALTTILLSVVTTIWLFFTHSNWRLSLGGLTPFVGGPQLHRLHHSRLPEHRNSNYAQFFPLIDRMFGTYREPKTDEFPATGL